MVKKSQIGTVYCETMYYNRTISILLQPIRTVVLYYSSYNLQKPPIITTRAIGKHFQRSYVNHGRVKKETNKLVRFKIISLHLKLYSPLGTA